MAITEAPVRRSVLVELLHRPRAAFGLVVIAVMVFAAVFAPFIMPHDPFEQRFDGLTLSGAPLSPGGEWLLGTDLLGRDLFSRLILGTRTSLVIGVLANGIAVVFGAGVGVVAGYFGGWLGAILMRFTDLMMAFPALLLAIVLAAIFQPSLLIVALVIAMVNWVQMARVIYTETRSLTEREFIQVQRAIGSGHLRILFRHLLPHSAVVDRGLRHARNLDHRPARSDAELSWGGRSAAGSFVGQHHLREPDLFHHRAMAGLLPGPRHRAAGPGLQPRGRCVARRARPDLEGPALMAAYMLRRLAEAALILLGISLVTFVLLYLVPADPARQIAGRSATAQTVENIRNQLGLNDPFFVQYGRYLWNLLQGDLGRSYLQRAEVGTLIASRLPASLLLMVSAIVLELIVGLTIGITAALRRNTFTDNALMVFSFVSISAPQFVIGILLLYVFAVQLHWFPIGGYGTAAHLVLPTVTLAFLGAGWYSRMMRSSVIDVLAQDFVRTARAKGLGRGRIIARHVFPNAILPIIAMVGIDIGLFFSGIVVVESVFGWPGIGQLAWQAIQRIDIPVIMGVTLVSAAAIVLGNLLADLIAPFVDPRIKLK